MPDSSSFAQKKSVIITSVAITILVATSIAIFYLGKHYSANILNEVISRETNGYYRLDFESLDLNVFESRITVKSLRLKFDSTKNVEQLGLSNIYEISLNELIIDLESIYALYLEKELIIKNVRVVDPDIHMISLKSAKRTNFSFEAGSMYKAISDYLKVLKIDYFRIQDGELQYNGNTFSLGKIDFLVKNLLMDSVSRKNQVFYSEQIELEIRNQLFHLPDSVHEITFERFVLSTSDSILSFENLRVRPTKSSGVTFKGNNDINVYDIHIPKLSFKGVDYISAYQSNHLIIDELVFEEPTVFIDDESHAANKKKDMDNSLLSLIFKVFGALDVGKLNIKNAHVDLKIDGKNYQRFKVERSNILFHKIHLDTTNYRFDHRFKYFEDIELDIHDYTYQLPDSIHTAYFELLRVNSFQSEFLLENVIVGHERAVDQTKALVDIEIPSLRLINVDFQRAIADKVLNVGTFQLEKASIDVINTGGSVKSDREAATLSTVYQALAPFFREVSIDYFKLLDSKLTLPKKIKMNRIDLELTGVYLNSASRSFQKLFKNSKLGIYNFSIDQDSIKIQGNKLLVSDKMSSFQLLDWEVQVEKNLQYVSGRFDSLKITDVSIDSLINGRYTFFKRAELKNPDFQFDIHSKHKGGRADFGIEKELIISGGQIAGTIDSLEISMEGVDADVFIGDSTAFRSVGIENIFIKSPTLNHTVQLESWMYDTLQGQMEFNHLVIKPLDQADTLNDLIDVSIPFIKLTEFEQAKFFDENHLFAEVMQVKKPIVKIKKQAKEQKEGESEKRNDFTFNVHKLEVDTGTFHFAPDRDAALDSLLVSSATFRLDDVDFPKSNPFESGSFYSKNLDLSIAEVIPYLSSKDSLSFGRISYESSNNSFKIDSIRFSSEDKSLVLNVPSTDLRNIDIEKLYHKREIDLDSLIVTSPSGYSFPKDSGNSSKPFTTPFSIDYFKVSGLTWNLTDSAKNQNYKLSNSNLTVSYFYSTDTLKLQSITNNVRKLTFNSGLFEVPLPDGYTIGTDNLQFEYPENNLWLSNVRLHSDYTAEEYSENLAFQNDWFDVTVDSIFFNNIDLDKIIGEHSYSVDKLHLKGLDALIYRDKGVPFPPDQVRDLPQKTIREVSVPFNIDTLSFSGGIRYREKPEDYFTYGEISFEKMQGSLINVGNENISENAMMLLDASGKLMGEGSFNVKGTYEMNSPDNRFSMNGTVVDFPLDSMNRMLGPVAGVNIKSGYAKELYFNFNADNTLAKGEMRFRYEDLKIQILNVKTHDTQGFGQGIKTFFANTFVVRNKNPSYLFFLRKGTIFTERDTSRAIFNYWGKSLLSGAVSSIGVHKADKAEKKFERNQD